VKQIYIGGIERSGTTFLAITLARYIEGIVIPEAPFKQDIVYKPIKQLSKDSVFRLNLWGLPSQVMEIREKAGNSLFIHCVEALCNDIVNTQGKTIIDHTPSNIYHAEQLLEHYNPSLFIYIQRDPAHVVQSLMRTDWGLPSAHLAYNFWRKRAKQDSKGLEYLNHHCPHKLVMVNYENLCANPSIIESLIPQEIAKEFKPNLNKNSLAFIPKYTTSQHIEIFRKATVQRRPLDLWTKKDQVFFQSLSQVYKDTTNLHLTLLASREKKRTLEDVLRTFRLPYDRLHLIRRRNLRGMKTSFL